MESENIREMQMSTEFSGQDTIDNWDRKMLVTEERLIFEQLVHSVSNQIDENNDLLVFRFNHFRCMYVAKVYKISTMCYKIMSSHKQ